MHNSQWFTLPIQSCLVLYSLWANFIHLLMMWLIVFSQLPQSLHQLFCYILFILPLTKFLWRCSVLLSEEIQFPLKVSFSYPCPSFLVWDFAHLSLETSIQLFFFLFLFSGYICFVNACIFYVVTGGCNQSSSALFYVVFWLLYRCINAILKSGESSSSIFF